MVLKRLSFWFLCLIFLLLSETIYGQCSMCKLMAEQGYQSGSGIGTGLNNGILYIMGIPYLLILVVGYLLFRQRRNHSAP